MITHKYTERFVLILVFITLFVSCLSDTERNVEQDRDEWYTSRKWLNGLELTPHETIDQNELKRQYTLNPEWWNTAFRILKDSNIADLKPGKQLIDSDRVFILVTEGVPSKDTAKADWEAHLKYADIHYVVSGKERIGLAPVCNANLAVPYDAARDIAFFYASGELYDADSTNFFVIFPDRAHCPQVNAGSNDPVKKVVVKVRLDD